MSCNQNHCHSASQREDFPSAGLGKVYYVSQCFGFSPPPLSLFGIKIKVNTKIFSGGYNIKNGYYCTISSNVIQLPSKCHPTVFKNGYYCIFGNILLLLCIFGNNSLLNCVFGNISLLHCIFSNQWMMKQNILICSMTLCPKTFLTLEA